jgi:pyridinium-3,5-biscarboxylic acid mononucleotide synthase
MDRKKIIELLSDVKEGRVEVEQAFEHIKDLPFSELEFARPDTHRQLRTGFPEVVLGQGKTVEQIIEISRSLLKHHDRLLITRVDREPAEAVQREVTELTYDAHARLLFHEPEVIEITGNGTVTIICAGTADLPVAREAAVTARLMGNRIEEIYDVGVAGIHRLLEHRERLQESAVIVVIAGMEGALASVVGGLVGCPVIAVPTSIGYGASFGGLAALLAMLNSCATGVAVVNIDNGFGAAAMASSINHLKCK